METISDREGIVPKALQRVYPLVFGKSQISMEEYIANLRSMPRQKTEEDIGLKLQMFTKTMKENSITGNEATQLLKLYQKVGFFEEEIKLTYLGRMVKSAHGQNFERLIVVRKKTDKENAYILATETLDLSNMSIREIEENLIEGEWIYEDSKQNMDRGDNG